MYICNRQPLVLLRALRILMSIWFNLDDVNINLHKSCRTCKRSTGDLNLISKCSLHVNLVNLIYKTERLDKALKEADSKNSIWAMKRMLFWLPLWLSYPIACFILKRKGKVHFESRRDIKEIEYVVVTRLDNGCLKVSRSMGAFDVPKTLKKKGITNVRRWVPIETETFEIKPNGRFTRTSIALKKRKVLAASNLTKEDYNAAYKHKLHSAFLCKAFGIKYNSSVEELETHITKLVYPWYHFHRGYFGSWNKYRNNSKYMWVENPAQVLNNFGIPAKKSLVRAVVDRVNKINPEAQTFTYTAELIPFNIAAIIWYLTKDVNHTRDALLTPAHHQTVSELCLDGHKRFFKKVYTLLGSKPSKLIKFLEYNDVLDTVRCMKQLYDAGADLATLDYSNMHNLHNSAYRTAGAITNKEKHKLNNTPFDYSDKIRRIASYPLSDGSYFVLPANGYALIDWGAYLHNCVGGYTGGVHDGRYYILGIRSALGDLKYVMELDRKEWCIKQLRGKYNDKANIELIDELCTVMEVDILQKERPAVAREDMLGIVQRHLAVDVPF